MVCVNFVPFAILHGEEGISALATRVVEIHLSFSERVPSCRLCVPPKGMKRLPKKELLRNGDKNEGGDR